MMNKEMIKDLVSYEGKQFSDNFSNTNSSLYIYPVNRVRAQ